MCLQLLLETVGGGSFGRRRSQNRHHHHRRDGDDEDGEEEDDGVSAVYVTTEGQFPVERLLEMWRSAQDTTRTGEGKERWCANE